MVHGVVLEACGRHPGGVWWMAGRRSVDAENDFEVVWPEGRLEWLRQFCAGRGEILFLEEVPIQFKLFRK